MDYNFAKIKHFVKQNFLNISNIFVLLHFTTFFVDGCSSPQKLDRLNAKVFVDRASKYYQFRRIEYALIFI